MRKRTIIEGILIVLVLALLSYLYFELRSVKGENAQLQAKLEDTDARTEGIENKIVTLKREGFVEEDTASKLANAILPSVVFMRPSSGGVVGTGFFISSDGYVATAKHVVSEISIEDITVEDVGGGVYAVENVFSDDASDVSVVKIATSKNHPVPSFGHFENLEIGSEVGVIGFNAGFTKPLLHTGTVSALGLDEGGAELFTINAFVNKGNSGSPVFSMATGRIVGILSTRQTETQSRRLLNPEEYQSGVSFGGAVDPVQFSAQLYNETVRLVEEVSQIGIGVAYSVDIANELLEEVLQ